MEKSDFYCSQKPSPVSFLFVYAVCFSCAYALIQYSPQLSKKFVEILVLLRAPKSNYLYNLPYGIILSAPFIFFGIRLILWNIMSFYEMDTVRIRLVTGYLSRKERFIPVSDIYEVSFMQNLIEAPFRIGSLLLTTRTGTIRIKGVYSVNKVVEGLRKKAAHY